MFHVVAATEWLIEEIKQRCMNLKIFANQPAFSSTLPSSESKLKRGNGHYIKEKFYPFFSIFWGNFQHRLIQHFAVLLKIREGLSWMCMNVMTLVCIQSMGSKNHSFWGKFLSHDRYFLFLFLSIYLLIIFLFFPSKMKLGNIPSLLSNHLNRAMVKNFSLSANHKVNLIFFSPDDVVHKECKIKYFLVEMTIQFLTSKCFLQIHKINGTSILNVNS